MKKFDYISHNSNICYRVTHIQLRSFISRSKHLIATLVNGIVYIQTIIKKGVCDDI